jgi:hypothetical protein
MRRLKTRSFPVRPPILQVGKEKPHAFGREALHGIPLVSLTIFLLGQEGHVGSIASVRRDSASAFAAEAEHEWRPVFLGELPPAAPALVDIAMCHRVLPLSTHSRVTHRP